MATLQQGTAVRLVAEPGPPLTPYRRGSPRRWGTRKGVRVAPETTSFPAVTIKPGRFPCPDESHTQMTTISPRGLKQMRAKENTHCHRLPPSCHYGSHCDDGLARPTGPRARPSPEPVLRVLSSPPPSSAKASVPAFTRTPPFCSRRLTWATAPQQRPVVPTSRHLRWNQTRTEHALGRVLAIRLDRNHRGNTLYQDNVNSDIDKFGTFLASPPRNLLISQSPERCSL